MKIKILQIYKRWQLFHARDFQSLMYPCFFFCSLCGLFPYKIVASNFVYSKIRLLFSITVAIIGNAYLFVVLYQADISGTLEYDTTQGMLQAHFYFILGGQISLTSYFLTGSRLKVIQDLADVSSRVPSEAFNKLSKWLHAKDILGFLFLICHIPNLFTGDISQTLRKVTVMYITMVIYLMDMFYMDCVCVLKACFERINESLRNLKEVIVTDEPYLLRRIYHEQKNPLLLIELKALKERHLQISAIVQVVNTTFSLQLLATVVLTFSEVTFSLYFYILKIHGAQWIDLEKQIWYSYFITSGAYYFIKLAAMVWACETSKDVASQIGSNIHEVLLRTFDIQIKNELELFSLQILHRDNVFSAKGLIIDATLLTKITSGVTTYLLILIQFLISAKSSTNIQS